jgi:hypothetical protein
MTAHRAIVVACLLMDGSLAVKGRKIKTDQCPQRG